MATARPPEPRLLVDPRRLRARCLALLARATDRYLRSQLFLQSMRLGLRAFTAHPLSAGITGTSTRRRSSAHRP